MKIKTKGKSTGTSKSKSTSKGEAAAEGGDGKKIRLVTDKDVGDMVTDAMSEYGFYVLEDRALPRLEDGMKPVQRRIIWAAHEMKAKSFMKSAKIVGETMGNFHPHGDSAIYQALVGLVHDRYAPIEGLGNFGGPTTEAAASRYTEARLSALVREIATDTPDMAVVPMTPNYDGKRMQPVYLPTRLPMLLLNGSGGIAVGLNSYLPPHNAKEVIAALVTTIETGDPDLGAKKIKGPDYGTGVLLSPRADVRRMYRKGEGTLEYDCAYSIEDDGKNKALVITSFAPDFNVRTFLEEKCAKLAADGSILYATDETSGKNGTRVVIGFNNVSALQQKVLPLLRKKLNYKFNVLTRKVVKTAKDGTPVYHDDPTKVQVTKTSLSNALAVWIAARAGTVEATLNKELADLKIDLEKEQGKAIAKQNLDKIVAILKTDKDLVTELIARLKMTQLQAETVAAMSVSTLQKSAQDKILARIEELKKSIKRVEKELQDVLAVIVTQLKDIQAWLSKKEPKLLERGTKIASADGSDASIGDLDSLKSDLKWLLWSGDKGTLAEHEPPTAGAKESTTKPVALTPFRDSLTMVYSDGSAVNVNAGKFKTVSWFRKNWTVVGAVGDEKATAIAAATGDGKVAVIDRQQKVAAEEYWSVVNTDKGLTHACGFVLGEDRVVAHTDRGDAIIATPDALKPSRKGAKAKGFGRVRGALRDFFTLGKDCVLVNSRGAVINVPEPEGDEKFVRVKVGAKKLFAVGRRNLVTYNGTEQRKGKREVLSRKETLAALLAGNIAEVFPVRVGKSTDEEAAKTKPTKKKTKLKVVAGGKAVTKKAA